MKLTPISPLQPISEKNMALQQPKFSGLQPPTPARIAYLEQQIAEGEARLGKNHPQLLLPLIHLHLAYQKVAPGSRQAKAAENKAKSVYINAMDEMMAQRHAEVSEKSLARRLVTRLAIEWLSLRLMIPALLDQMFRKDAARLSQTKPQ